MIVCMDHLSVTLPVAASDRTGGRKAHTAMTAAVASHPPHLVRLPSLLMTASRIHGRGSLDLEDDLAARLRRAAVIDRRDRGVFAGRQFAAVRLEPPLAVALDQLPRR